MSLIICGVATVKDREEALKDTVLSIINQVDKLIVYQNGYKEIFDFLNNEKIEVYSSIDTGVDMGDAGKFYKVQEYDNSYYLSIDDDLIYPSDYVSNIINNLNKYNNDVIISHHGRTLKPDAKSYYNDAIIKLKCLNLVNNYQEVQFGGTGVMGFHTNKIKLNFNMFKEPNMADIWVGLYAIENKIPIIVAPHNEGWIKHSDKFDLNTTIYALESKFGVKQNNLIINMGKNMVTQYNDNKTFTFLIPSYNRYDKLINLINQINTYNNVNIVIYNDASNDSRYNDLNQKYQNLTIMHGTSNNGKSNYNKTLVSLFNLGLSLQSDYYVLLADDFILCKDFIKNLSLFLNENNIVNIFSIREEGWGSPGWVDGALSCSVNALMELMNLIPKTIQNVEGKSTGVWRYITTYFLRSNRSNYKLTTLNYSLTQHDGNDDSKLHPKHRLKVPIVANNFYDNFIGNEIKIIGQSILNSKNSPQTKKKSSDGTSNGNAVEVKKPEPPKTIVINNKKAILPNAEKLHKPNNPISKIGDDALLAKIRRKNTGFGGRR